LLWLASWLRWLVGVHAGWLRWLADRLACCADRLFALGGCFLICCAVCSLAECEGWLRWLLADWLPAMAAGCAVWLAGCSGWLRRLVTLAVFVGSLSALAGWLPALSGWPCAQSCWFRWVRRQAVQAACVVRMAGILAAAAGSADCLDWLAEFAV